MIELETQQLFQRHNRGSGVDIRGSNDDYYASGGEVDDEEQDLDENPNEDQGEYYYDPETGEYYEVDGEQDLDNPIVDEAEEYENDVTSSDLRFNDDYERRHNAHVRGGFNQFSVNINLNNQTAVSVSPSK